MITGIVVQITKEKPIKVLALLFVLEWVVPQEGTKDFPEMVV